MNADDEPLAKIRFKAEIVEWRGPAPYLFVTVPDEHIGEIRYASRLASYGWGVIPVEARIGPVGFTTSLFPRNGTYVLPVKVSVQRAAGVKLGDSIEVLMQINSRSP